MSKPTKSRPVVVYLPKGLSKIKRAVPAEGKARKPLTKKSHEPHHAGGKMEGPPAIRKEVEPDSIRLAWIGALGGRLKIDQEKGFYLDGRPVSLDDLMLETNRIRKANGMEPVGRNPRWLP
jgi:hypothetical protein